MLFFTFYISKIQLNDKLPSNQLIIPEKIASIWKINSSIPAKITYHFLSKEIEVSRDTHLDMSSIELHPKLAAALSLPLNGKIICQYDQKENSFRFGPAIGVVIGDIAEITDYPFGELTPYFTEMAKTAEMLFYPFIVFSYREQTGSFIEASSYHDGEWKKSTVPLPQVVYNRIGRRDQEKSKQCQDFFNRLKEINIPYFNDRFLHKLDTYNYFNNEQTLKPFLPESRPFSNREDLKYMLKKYSSLYIKPFWGKEGAGIIRVEVKENAYFITFPIDQGWQTKKVESMTQLYILLKARIKKRMYIIQRTIQVEEKFNAPVDFRILCIKNSTGLWQTCSAIARIGQKDLIVSNLAKGGTQRKAIAVLEEILSTEDAIQTERFMHELAIQCAQVLDTEARGLYGELGFDFILDNKGKLWILEVNIKPSKGETVQVIGNTFPSIKLLLTYAAYLAGFSDK